VNTTVANAAAIRVAPIDPVVTCTEPTVNKVVFAAAIAPLGWRRLG
jgi:hypothetical protein